MSIKIITDSAADLPEEVIKKYDIDVLPLQVIINDEVFLDGETLKPVELLKGMREGKQYKTAQVPLNEFKAKFEKYAEEDHTYIYIAFSSELSGTYQAAVLARNQVQQEFKDFEIEIIDTRCASLGFGLVVYKAAVMASEGKSKDEIIENIHFYKDHMEHIFTVDDLEYLYRGGRVSRTSAFVAGILNIKPILEVEDGKLVPLEKRKGRKRVMKRMLTLMEERGENLGQQLVAISHGDDLETAEKLKDMIKEKFGTENFLINTIGGVVGAHAGPGTIALFFLNKTKID
ncbi:MAG: DegV family protein [Halanaerobiales bacterium]